MAPPDGERALPDAAGSRRLRVFELALVVGSAFLLPAILSLHDWWLGESAPAETWLSAVDRIVTAALAIALLGYVLHRRGRSLGSLGLTMRWTDIGWALLILFFARLAAHAAFLAVAAMGQDPGAETVRPGIPDWLGVIPSAAKEELIVRAFLMTEVAALTGSMAIAVLASVGLQAFYHLYQGPVAAWIGAAEFFVFAVFYASMRRITPVIAAHSLHNFWVLAIHPG